MDKYLMGAILRLLILLPLVLGLAYLVIRFGLRGFGYSYAGQSSFGMSVIDRLPLGPKSSLVVVRVAGNYFLMSCNEGKVELLRELDSYPEVELGEEHYSYYDKDIFTAIKDGIRRLRSRGEG